MDGILNWGLDVVIEVQKFRTPWLDSLFLFITSLGNSFFYFLIIPLLYWCIDKKMAANLIIIFCFSNWVNSEFKQLFQQPRPYNLDQSVQIGHTGGPGLPSGHAQGSLILWGYLAVWKNKKTIYLLSGILILLIAFSRIYLGVHFPTDILGGWFLAILILSLYFLFHTKFEEWISNLNFTKQIILSFSIPLLLAFINPTKWSIFPIATLGGFGVGYCVERIKINFDSAGKLYKKILRYFIGMIIIGIINYGLKEILPIKDAQFYISLLYVRYWITGFFLSLGAPWVFKKLNL